MRLDTLAVDDILALTTGDAFGTGGTVVVWRRVPVTLGALLLMEVVVDADDVLWRVIVDAADIRRLRAVLASVAVETICRPEGLVALEVVGALFEDRLFNRV